MINSLGIKLEGTGHSDYRDPIEKIGGIPF
jgi:hypothetical protein